MRRSALVVGVAAVGLAVGPAAAPTRAAEPVAVQHASASAHAELVRYEFFRPLVLTGADVAVATTDVRASSYSFPRSQETVRASGSQVEGIVAGRAIEPAGAASATDGGSEGRGGPAIGVGGARAETLTTRVDAGSLRDPAAACARAAPGTDTLIGRSSASALTAATTGMGLPDVTVPDASSSSSETRLRAGDGTLGVESVASAKVATVRIAGAYTLRVVGEPRLVASVTGIEGGATIGYSAPVVEVTDDASGETIARLDAASPEVRLDVPSRESGLQGFANVRLGAPHDVIATWDGTFARAEADLLEIRWTDFAGALEQWDSRIAALSASASVPSGGIVCGSPPPQRDLPRVLVYSGWQGFEHLSIPKGEQTIAELSDERRAFTTTFTDNAAYLRPDVLRDIDVVVWNNTTGSIPWTAEQKQLFIRWMECGGAAVGIHSAADANYDWPEYGEMLGAQFQGHPHVGYWPIVGEARLLVEDQTHPATEPWHGMDSVRLADEYYRFRADPRGTQDVNVLLSLDEQTVYPWIRLGLPVPTFGGSYVPHQPLAWTKTFRGHGRVFYTNLGHNPSTFDRGDVRRHLRNGIEWAAGGRVDRACLDVGA